MQKAPLGAVAFQRVHLSDCILMLPSLRVRGREGLGVGMGGSLRSVTKANHSAFRPENLNKSKPFGLLLPRTLRKGSSTKVNHSALDDNRSEVRASNIHFRRFWTIIESEAGL